MSHLQFLQTQPRLPLQRQPMHRTPALRRALHRSELACLVLLPLSWVLPLSLMLPWVLLAASVAVVLLFLLPFLSLLSPFVVVVLVTALVISAAVRLISVCHLLQLKHLGKVHFEPKRHDFLSDVQAGGERSWVCDMRIFKLTLTVD